MNAFEQIESNENIPDHVKAEMLSSLDTFKLIADVVDLFFVKSGQATAQLLSSQTNENTALAPEKKLST